MTGYLTCEITYAGDSACFSLTAWPPHSLGKFGPTAGLRLACNVVKFYVAVSLPPPAVAPKEKAISLAAHHHPTW